MSEEFLEKLKVSFDVEKHKSHCHNNACGCQIFSEFCSILLFMPRTRQKIGLTPDRNFVEKRQWKGE